MINNTKKCPRFNSCSYAICPLDPEAHIRIKLRDDDSCPFCLNKNSGSHKWAKTRMQDGLLELVSKQNIKLLNKRNQRRRISPSK